VSEVVSDDSSCNFSNFWFFKVFINEVLVGDGYLTGDSVLSRRLTLPLLVDYSFSRGSFTCAVVFCRLEVRRKRKFVLIVFLDC
jgi:hypothetical protein